MCRWDWSKKPDTSCPGVPRYDWGKQPEELRSLIELHKQNLKPKAGTLKAGCRWLKSETTWLWLYDINDAEVDDPDLPPIYSWDARPPELKTPGELRQQSLSPEGVSPKGCAWVFDKKEEWGKWIYLYHPEDCQWKAKDNYISKQTLKTAYLLSDRWIFRLGSPDREVENPHYRRAAPMKLYSRQRVEEFLALHAEDYARWLDERDRYLAIAEAQKPHREAARAEAKKQKQLVADQTARCLKCASGCATPHGFLCAIYPMGFPCIPCPDWQERLHRGRAIAL